MGEDGRLWGRMGDYGGGWVIMGEDGRLWGMGDYFGVEWIFER